MKIIEVNAFVMQPIQRWCFQDRIPVTGKIAIPLIIG